MKTDKVDIKVLETLMWKKKQKGTLKCWVCGEDYLRELKEVSTEDQVYLNYLGRYFILGLQVALTKGHPKIGDNEIVLFTEKEFEIALRQQERENE